MNKQRFQLEQFHVSSEINEPLFQQLERQLRHAVWQGMLKAGERLPSTRALAKELGIARNTVVKAYEQLELEGFITTFQGSGTKVAEQFPPAYLSQKPLDKNQHAEDSKASKPYHFEPTLRIKQAIEMGFGNRIVNNTPARPFRAHRTAIQAFPFDVWAQILQRKLKFEATMLMSEAHPLGYLPLREAIADYLGATRGLQVDSQQVVITSGTQQSIELLARILLNPDDTVAFEEPGYTPALASCQFYGANTLSIPIDEQGLQVSELHKLKSKLKFVYVTPASHFPLGTTMSQARRQELLQWADQQNSLIIEDDYNGEYRYRGRPLPTLFSMTDKDRCIYLGSFSKLLFPSLRLGYMIVPKSMLEALTASRWLLDRHSPPLQQAVLTEFINKGHFVRHIRKMRTLYASRQQTAVSSAKKHLNNIMDVPSQDGGLHLIGWLSKGVNEKDLLLAAEQVGVELMPSSAFSLKGLKQSSVIIGYAPYSKEQIEQAFKALAEAYRENFTNNH